MSISNNLMDRIARYGNAISLSELATNRIVELVSLIEDMFVTPCEDIFVSELNAPGTPMALGSLFAFSRTHLYEFKAFLGQVNWDMTTLSSAKYVNTVVRDYDMRLAVPLSFMHIRVEVNLPNSTTWQWAAVGPNCDFSLNILKTYILPSIV